jgi:hypothetical protein
VYALLILAVSGCAAAIVAVWRTPGNGVRGLACALAAAVVAALAIFVVATVLLHLPHWVPDTSPANVPPADRLDNNRAGAEDPYYGVLMLGALLAFALTAALIATRRAGPMRTTTP